MIPMKKPSGISHVARGIAGKVVEFAERQTFSPAWNALKTGSSTFEPLLDHWLASVREYGLLDESATSK